MRKIREVLRLKHEHHLSGRQIAMTCCVGRGTVQEYLSRAQAAGLSWPLPEHLNDEEIENLLFPSTPPSPEDRSTPDWHLIACELRRKGVTLRLLWEEYQSRHPDGYSYSHFCELYRKFSKGLEPRMRQVHNAGEKLFVDFAGQTIPVIDPETGELRQAQVFVATLGASDYTFAMATWTQNLKDWIDCHMRAFEFFGGVPQIVVPDNLKAGVTSPCFYEPEINPTYAEMAAHYAVAVMPARIARPRDKAKVENHVLNVERRVLAPLRNRSFFNLEQCNQAIMHYLAQLNRRPFQQLKGSRRELFENLDRPALCPLPVETYEFAEWKKARVNVDYHIFLKHCFYSVPYALLKQEVQVRYTSHVVEVFHKGQRVASHLRSGHVNSYTTVAEHMPKSHRAHCEWTPARLVQWARKNGEATAQVVESLLSSRRHPEQGYRSCLGIMRLGKHHGTDRLEAACAKALAINAPRYKSIESILKRKLEHLTLPDSPASIATPSHDNLRGPSYYQRTLALQSREPEVRE